MIQKERHVCQGMQCRRRFCNAWFTGRHAKFDIKRHMEICRERVCPKCGEVFSGGNSTRWLEKHMKMCCDKDKTNLTRGEPKPQSSAKSLERESEGVVNRNIELTRVNDERTNFVSKKSPAVMQQERKNVVVLSKAEPLREVITFEPRPGCTPRYEDGIKHHWHVQTIWKDLRGGLGWSAAHG